MVALNRFTTDSDEEIEAVRAVGAAEGVDVLRCDVWEKGGEGGVAVAEALLGLLKTSKSTFKPLYDERRPIREKIETIAREIYGAGGVSFAPAADRALELLPKLGLARRRCVWRRRSTHSPTIPRSWALLRDSPCMCGTFFRPPAPASSWRLRATS